MADTLSRLEQLAQTTQEVFETILNEQMAGIPILNPALQVQALGFQEYEGRILGIVITPWLMNLILFPNSDDDWETLEIGKKVPREYPSGTLKFMVNEFDRIGICQTHSLYSPMSEFRSQQQAIVAAESFLQNLFVENDSPDDDPHDEELLGRILRGEEGQEIEVNLADFDSVSQHPDRTRTTTETTLSERMEKPISRRKLLSGGFLKR